MIEWIIEYRSSELIDYETRVTSMRELYYVIGVIYNCNATVTSVKCKRV